jgi:hypothetical protein
MYMHRIKNARSRTWICKKHNVLSITCLPFHHILYVLMQRLITTVRIDNIIQYISNKNRDDKNTKCKWFNS